MNRIKMNLIKMKRIKMYAVLAAALLSITGTASATSITFDLATNNYLPGDSTVTFDLNLSIDRTDIAITHYALNFEYDQNELSFLSHVNYGQTVFSDKYAHNVFGPYGAIPDNLRDDPVNGTLTDFFTGINILTTDFAPNWENLHEYLPANTPTLIASFTFSVLTDAVLDGTTDFKFDQNLDLLTNDPSFLDLWDGNGHIRPTTILGNAFDPGLDIAPIPEPGTAFLFGLGLLLFAGAGRKTV